MVGKSTMVGIRLPPLASEWISRSSGMPPTIRHSAQFAKVQYLRFYAETDEHRLELLLALAHKDADALADEACLALLDHFLARLETAVANRLDALDHAVACLIEANPKWVDIKFYI